MRHIDRYCCRAVWRRRMVTCHAAIGHIPGWCIRIGADLCLATATNLAMEARATGLAAWLAAHGEHAGPARPLPAVRTHDRRNRRCRCTGTGAHGVPFG